MPSTLISTLIATDQPRISFNKLCEYPHLSLSGRRRIAREQKYPAEFQVSYYQEATFALLRAIDPLSGRIENTDVLEDAAAELGRREAAKRFQQIRLSNNIQALRRLVRLAPGIVLPPGEHEKVLQKAMMNREGVTISVRPEFITKNRQMNTIAFTKFRFSKSPVSADAVETGLALLLEFAREARFSGQLLDLEHTTIVDIFSGSIVHGHTVGRHRLLELNRALQELVRIWPQIRPSGERSQPPLNGPAG